MDEARDGLRLSVIRALRELAIARALEQEDQALAEESAERSSMLLPDPIRD